VYTAAADGEAEQQRDQKCEADFYIGEWTLADADSAAALSSLKSAAAACPHNFIEFSGAQSELKRMPPRTAAGGM
jgi:lipoprotein NlpI